MKTFDEMRKEIGAFLQTNEGAKLWDVMCALRGPDTPSERPDMGSKESSAAYAGRRKRKHSSTELIRERAFFGVIGGCARHHDGDTITLPPSIQWDHFDKHMARAAEVLGLKVMTRQTEEGTPVKIVGEPKQVVGIPTKGIGSLEYYQLKLSQAQTNLANAVQNYQKHYWGNVVKNYSIKIADLKALQEAQAASAKALLDDLEEIEEEDNDDDDDC